METVVVNEDMKKLAEWYHNEERNSFLWSDMFDSFRSGDMGAITRKPVEVFLAENGLSNDSDILELHDAFITLGRQLFGVDVELV